MIIFRADGNDSIGLGHIMRCLSIADTAKKLGEKCLFITAGKECLAVITSHGHECIVLDTDYTDMSTELKKLLSVIHKNQPSALFVDSYFVTNIYLKQLWILMKELNGKLIYIDDVLAFPYPCDIIINYNIYGPDKASNYNSLYSEAKMFMPKFLLGTSYAPLREEFQNIPKHIVKKEAQNIFISTGGADFEHLTIEMVKEIKKSNSQYIFCFVIGEMNKDKKIIHNISKDDSRILLFDNVKQMAKLMSGCDVAISASGSTLYELCAVQIPTVTYILADNQILGAEGFHNHNILEYVGDVRNMGVTNLSKHLIKCVTALADNYEKRLEISAKMRNIVDGQGANNLLKFINKQ